MAEKPCSRDELVKLSKPELQEMATELGIEVKALLKEQLIERILEAYAGARSKVDVDNVQSEDDADQFDDPGHSPTAESKPRSLEFGANDSEQFRMRMLELEMQREREAEAADSRLRELEIQRDARAADVRLRELEMQHRHEIEMAQLQPGPDRRTPDNAFRIDSAVKLMPRLTSENDIDVYLVTFEKIALLNKWPQEYWSALLQTQLRGKGLKVFSELSTQACRNYDTLKQAVLTAYELCSDVYRKRFRSLSKQANDTYADFAFKLTNVCKRWLQSVNAFDNIEALRQAILMEQFMEMLPTDLTLWLFDQKTKTIDEMARAADQYSALRKSVVQTDNTKPDTSVLTSVKYENKTRAPYMYAAKQAVSSAMETQGDNKSWQKLKKPVKCFYCHKLNHTISECRLRKKANANKEQTVNVKIHIC